MARYASSRAKPRTGVSEMTNDELVETLCVAASREMDNVPLYVLLTMAAERIETLDQAPWPYHKKDATVEQIVRDGVYRDLSNEQILFETNYRADDEMINNARYQMEIDMARSDLMDGTL